MKEPFCELENGYILYFPIYKPPSDFHLFAFITWFEAEFNIKLILLKQFIVITINWRFCNKNYCDKNKNYSFVMFVFMFSIAKFMHTGDIKTVCFTFSNIPHIFVFVFSWCFLCLIRIFCFVHCCLTAAILAQLTRFEKVILWALFFNWPSSE